MSVINNLFIVYIKQNYYHGCIMANLDNSSIIILPVDEILHLEITENGSPADGESVNVAVAYLDNDGELTPGIMLQFEITDPATFKGGGKRLSVPTDDTGKAKVEIVATSNTDVTATVTCTVMLNVSVTANANTYFKGNPIIPSFSNELLKRYAVTSSTDYGSVRAVITLPAGTPAQSYIVRFYFITTTYDYAYHPNDGVLRHFGIGKPNAPKSTEQYVDIPVQTSGTITNVDAWVWCLETNFNLTATAVVHMELRCADGNIIIDHPGNRWVQFRPIQ